VKQRRYIANEFERDPDYVLRQAEIVRAQPRDNRARALLAAIRDDWQKGVSTVKTKAKPQRPRQAEPDPQELPLSFEERISRLATLKAEVKDV
jgi:hypothetical protein